MLYNYHITKANGEPVDPDAYFVLRLDTDPHARKALLTYARSVAAEDWDLAQELYALLYRAAAGTDHDDHIEVLKNLLESIESFINLLKGVLGELNDADT